MLPTMPRTAQKLVLRVAGWVGRWVNGWVAGENGNNTNSASVEV